MGSNSNGTETDKTVEHFREQNIIFVMERWKLEVFRMGCYLMFPGVMMYLFNTNYHMNNYFIPYLKKTDRNAYTNLTGDYEDEEEKKRMTRFNN